MPGRQCNIGSRASFILFGHKRASLEKVLANANKAIEKSTKFINKIKSRQLTCANRAKSIPEKATIRKDY
jgi:hypothetical protein